MQYHINLANRTRMSGTLGTNRMCFSASTTVNWMVNEMTNNSLFRDGLHPNEQGYEIIAKELKDRF